jgi:hypothetical protein
MSDESPIARKAVSMDSARRFEPAAGDAREMKKPKISHREAMDKIREHYGLAPKEYEVDRANRRKSK